MKRNNNHLKATFYSDLDKTDFTHLTINGVIDGLLSICSSDDVENHISSQLYLYVNNLQLIKDALENSNIVSHVNK